jgi:hypothetical protein
MLKRRTFMAQLAAAGAAIAVTAVPMPLQAIAAVGRVKAAVVSIHMDQPYLDPTGRALPYLPPPGLRAGAPLADLSEAEFRRCFVYL